MFRKNILYTTIFLLIGLFVVTPTNVQAATVQEEIIYDILIDRFNNGDQSLSAKIDLTDPKGYHGGDIQGIINRLDELKESGFTTINLSSLFSNAPRGYHGYWIEDHYEIEAQFGTIDTLKELVKEAHKRDMKVMMELVTNYIAESHSYVTDGKHKDWFTENTVEAKDANHWLSDVMVLDQTNEEVQQYVLDVATYWMDEVDIDGFTLHAVDQMDASFLATLTSVLKKKDNQMMIIGTVLDQQANVEELFKIENLDAVQNPQIMDKLVEVIQEPDHGFDLLDDILLTPDHAKSLLMVDNKNTPRFSNVVRDHDRNSLTAWKIALAYLYMMPGTPVIYQGSEVPMYGPGFPENQMLVDNTGAEPDLDDTFNKYSSLRDQFKKFVNGNVSIIGRENGMTLYELSVDEEKIYVAINNDSKSNAVKLTDMSEDLQLRGLLHDDTIRQNNDGVHSVGLERESAEVFILQPNTGFNWSFIALVGVVFFLFIAGVIYLSVKQNKQKK